MTFQLDFATIASILSFILAIAAILNMAIKEGERREAVKQMTERISKLENRQDRTDECNSKNGELLGWMKATLEGLASSVDKMQLSIEKLVSGSRNN